MALSVDKLLSKAKSATRKGNITEAEAAYKAVLERFPKNKRAADGLKSLQQKASLSNNPPQDQLNIIIGLLNNGRLDECLQYINRLIPHYPQSIALYDLSASALLNLGRYKESAEKYDRVLQINPSFAEAHNNKGFCLKELGHFEEAVTSCQKAVSLKPNYFQAYVNLGNAFQAQENFEAAVKCYKTTLKLNPKYLDSYLNLGSSLIGLERFKEATEIFKQSVALNSQDAELFLNYGIALQATGQMDEARAYYIKAIEKNSRLAKAYRNYTTITKLDATDPYINKMTALLDDANTTEADRILLNFALGKAKSDVKDYNGAYELLSSGNHLRKKALAYNISQDRELFADIKTAFQRIASEYSENSQNSENGKTPVFILGMPRSGTTLVEQIVSSHSKIWGAGELPHLENAILENQWKIGSLSQDTFAGIHNNYMEKLDDLDVSESYITDKMPANFKWVGFIIKAFPNAKIIHIKRNRAATCWSNYKLYFPANGMGFTCNQEDLAHYYILYKDIMEFWHTLFPNSIYDLDYESLTEDQQGETEKLLSFMGIDWEDGVLDFHKNTRSVITASSVQVRKKIYKGSSQEWENYKEHLGPMLKILEDY